MTKKAGLPMTSNDPTELYLVTINARPVPDQEQQFSWARAIDLEQQRYNRAIADDAAVTAILLECYVCTAPTGRAGRIVARGLMPAAASELTSERTGLLLDECMRKLNDLVSASAQHDAQACYAVLQPLRLRTEFMVDLIAVVESHGLSKSANFIHNAKRAVKAIGGLTNHLVQANQRMVAMLARKYRYGPLPFMDLVQEGNLGLLRAIERFDPEQGTRMSTYAMWWIRRAMVYAIARQGRDVRPSVAQYWEARQVARTLDSLGSEQQPCGKHAATADRLGISVDIVHRALVTLLPPLALDAPLAATEGICRMDILVDALESGPEARIVNDDMRRAVAELLTQLPERQARILQMRFGIGVRDDCTLEQIARQQGVTRERIRQLEAQALTSLRALSSTWALRGCLN